MKIALLGYGKMGQAIEQIALQRGHQIVLKKTENNSFDGLEFADVAIDFSTPTAAFENISTCLRQQIPIVSGTTGWLNQLAEIEKRCRDKKGCFIYSSNFSLGVNLFFQLNETLANLLSPYSDYRVALEEIHHTQKLDAPSGTAISLANQIIENSNYCSWTLDKTNNATEIHIDALRQGVVPGTHTVRYTSPIDSIEIKHTAHNRSGFALGAVIAAEWLIGKTGVFTMKDVLGLG